MDLINQNKEKFDIYFHFLVEENKKYNLTAITEEKDVYIKHFYDSLLLGKVIDLNQKIKICDVGSGAGFPGIPLLICYPNIELTIIEPTQKRVKFLQMLCGKLNLNVRIINGRAEDNANAFEEEFDIVTARAVAETNILLELLVKICKTGGKIALYKGDKANEELINARHALEELYLKVDSINHFDLEEGYGSRNIVVFNKTKKTSNKYPRRYAEIVRKPL